MWKEINIEKLVPAGWNYKTNEPALTEKLKQNIKRNGLIQNLIVREVAGKYEVCNGNHRYDVVKALKMKSVMCYNLGEVTDSYAYKIAITTNETKFGTDKKKLAELIRDLNQEFGIEDLVKTMPYSAQDIENMQAALDFQWESEDTLKHNSGGSDGEYEDSGDSHSAPERESLPDQEPSDLKKIELNLKKDVSEQFLSLIVKLANGADVDVEPSDIDNSNVIKVLNKKLKGLL